MFDKDPSSADFEWEFLPYGHQLATDGTKFDTSLQPIKDLNPDNTQYHGKCGILHTNNG